MIQKDTQEKLLGIIREEMIPEYKNSLVYKEELKDVFKKLIEKEYLTEEDKRLIDKYPDFVNTTTSFPIAYYHSYRGGDIVKIEYFKGYWTRDDSDLCLTYDTPLPVFIDKVSSLKGVNSKAWNKISPFFYKYINARNIYIKKLNIAYEFLSHKNTTVTLIKNEFPELYKLYKR